MNIKSFPNNQDEYVGAEHLMRWFHGRTSGVWGAEGNAAVASVPDQMQVTVSDGTGWLANAGADGIVWWNDTEEKTGNKLVLDVDLADGALDRIDRVAVSWQTVNYVALPTITVVKGTPASNPVPPALTNNAGMRQISLAQIRVRAGTLSIRDADITDERLDESVCGLVTDRCEIDTSMILQQVRGLVEDAKEQSEAMIDAIEQELANAAGGSAYDLKPVRAENVVVSAEAFEEYIPAEGEEQKLYDLGYTHRAAVAVAGVLSSMTPYVTLSLADVEESGAGIANQFQTYAGGVYVYADGVPGGSITALTVECRKAVTV
jgi:hypothetical protein